MNEFDHVLNDFLKIFLRFNVFFSNVFKPITFSTSRRARPKGTPPSSHIDVLNVIGQLSRDSVFDMIQQQQLLLLLLLLLLLFNNFFSGTTWESRHQKGKPFWILMKQQNDGWQWHQLDHMQNICTSLQTDNSDISPLCFTSRMPLLTPNQQHQSTERKNNNC